MSVRYCTRGVIAAFLFAPYMNGAAAIAAQTGTVTGTITDAVSGQPIGEASVSLVGTVMSRMTNLAGHYVLTGIPAGVYTVKVRALGYGARQREVEVTEGSQVASFQLKVPAIDFDEVVTTGLGGPVARRKLGTSLPTLTAGGIEASGPADDFSQVLEGSIPGVRSYGTSGGVGASRELRIRGTDSFGYTRQRPVVYVDGIRVDAVAGEWGAMYGVSCCGFSGGVGEDRLTDLNPEEIDRVQVLKGPAAATLYGAEASAGVIQVFTKRGQRNTPTTMILNTGVGLNRLRANLPTTLRSGVRGPYGLPAWDPNETLIENGLVNNYDLTVSGGGEAVAYFVSGGLTYGEGSVKPNDQTRGNLRVNMDWTAAENVSVSIASGYSRNRIWALQSGNNWLGVYTNAMLSNPYDATEEEPYGGGMDVNVADAKAISTISDTDRWTGRIQLNHTPGQNFTQQLTVGWDVVGDQKSRQLPVGRYYTNVGEEGERNLGQRSSRKVTAHYLSRFDYEGLFGLSFLAGSLSIGGQGYWDTESILMTTGRGFAHAGEFTYLGNAAAILADDRSWEESGIGAFVQNRLDLSDDLFLTLALRVDGHSLFGDYYGRAVYPKADFAYNLPGSVLPSAISHLRVRGAVGEAGKPPPRAVATWTTFIPGEPPLVRDEPGDEHIEPENKREIEAGLDIGLMEDRIGLELTYYDARTLNALAFLDMPPSSGGFSAVRNCCEIMNRGVEAGLVATPVDLQSFRWTTRLVYEWNRNRIVDLGPYAAEDSIPAYQQRDDGTWEFSHWDHGRTVGLQGWFEGESLGAVYGYGIAGYDPATNTHVRTLHSFTRGNRHPAHVGSIFNGFQIGNHLRLSFQIRGEMGAVMLNSSRGMGIRRLAHDEVLKHLDTDGSATHESDSILDWHRTARYPIDKRDHIRLQQVALAYSLPEDVSGLLGLQRTTVTLSGYNLHWWDDCNCPDPGAPGFMALPQPRRILLSVRTRF